MEAAHEELSLSCVAGLSPLFPASELCQSYPHTCTNSYGGPNPRNDTGPHAQAHSSTYRSTDTHTVSASYAYSHTHTFSHPSACPNSYVYSDSRGRHPASTPAPQLTVHFIDVGQGDAILVDLEKLRC